MNKHCFRLIFSKSLGFLIPVAETTSAQRKPGQTSGPSASSIVLPNLSFKRLALSLMLAGIPGWAAADILVDSKNPSGTDVISAANGVPVIDIANPNGTGLSHNRFSEFDVQNPGVIFNNSLVNGKSQLGGAVLRNPNLQRSATAILSEVTGNKPSSINGTLEVFGGKADLLIANPNGVTLNGVTTLNSSALTVSTGHVKDADGSLQFLVDDKSGQVIIGADGVNTAGLSYFDIVAKSVALQGKLGSDALETDLQVTAGQGTYDTATRGFKATTDAQGSGLAISGDAAGAMHGRFINLISTDSGAGVRQDGLILAAKDIAISADGDIQLNNTTTKTQVQIASTATVINTGTLEASTTQVKAQNVLNQNGATLGGTEALNIEATKAVSNNGGKLIGKTVSVKADTISNTNKGQILATDIALKAETAFTHDSNASIVAAKDLSIDTTKFTATTGELLAGDSLTLAADSYQNSATISSKNNASLTLKHGNDLVIDTSFKGPQAGGLLALSARDVTITDELNNAGSVAINASRDVRNQGAVIVGKTLAITAKGLIDNQAGKLIWAGENLVLDAGTQLLNGENSQLLSMGDMSLSAGEKVQNNVGRIEAQKNLWIDTPLLENLSQSTGGLKQIKVAEEDHYFGDSYGAFDWTQYFRTRISLPVFASDLTVKQAVIKAGGDLQLNAEKAKDATAKVRNVGGLIAATGDVQVKGDLENVGLSTTRTLMDALKSSQTMTRWTSNDDLVKDESPTYGTLYDLLERTYGGPSNSGWTNSLQLVNTPEVNQLLSAVLGADWKALDRGSLQARWRDFKFSNKTQPYYADQQAEISAGNAFVHTDGTFANGDGTNAGAQRPITIKVGSETVQSLDGELDAQFNLKRADAEKALSDLLGNPLFQKSQSGDTFGRIKPLYETRAKYLDQSQFLGSDYFLQKIGYDPQKTVSVLGDAYFDNQLILQSVEQRVGNFFAQTQRISGTDLAKQLLDNGAALALKEGLTLGQPLSGAQIAGLEKDVVWYENREVDGQMVLAPRVYLSQKTLAARDKDANSAALVSADVVLIDANTVNNINGTVRGNTDTFVYSKTDINNVSKGGAQAGVFAGVGGKDEKAGQLVIAAEGKVNNQGGVMSGFEQTVVGGKGISSSATTGYDKNGSLVVRDNGILGTALSTDKPAEAAKPESITAQTTLADTAKPADQSPTKVAAPDVRAIFNERLAAGPVDTSQGSSLNVISGGDIDLTGAITQSDNVSLQTSGNLNLNDLHEARSAFASASGGGFLSSVHIQEKAASANSVGNTLNAKNLQINAQGNLNITGGEVNAQNSAIEVGGDSTIKAGKDLAFHEKTTKTTQLVFGGGAGAAGYEVTGSFGSADKTDTHLGGAFAGSDGDAAVSLGGTATDGAPAGFASPRGDVYAGRAAATQVLASNGTGARSGANKGRGGTSGANLKIGLETVTTTDTSESATYRNAQLNLGNGSVKVGGTLDIGGADINAGYQLSPQERAKLTVDQRKAITDGLPTLAISAGDIKTTKVENTEKTTHSRDELFVGVTSEVHSSAVDIATQAANLAYKALGTDVVKDPNAPAGSSKTLATEDRKMDVDPALTALAVVGMVTQAAFGEVAGQSTTFGIKHTEQKNDSTTRSENINQIGGNISLTSTKGDIELNGVNLQGGKVGIKSAGNLTQRAAKSSTLSHDSTNTQSAGLTTSIGVSPTGAGMGVSVGADGSGDKTTTTSTSYTNGLISGTEVSIETKGDHNLIGSNIKGNEVAVKVGGNQNITSVQDTSDMTHERNNWSASVGVAITTNGLVQGTGSASASYGQDFDRSKLVAEQAGISGDKLDLNVAGNLNLTGANITSQKGQGNVQVGGKINAQNLQDTREKDGGYGGGGAGISKNGLASVTLEFGRVDQVHYNATNAATIDVGDPSKVTAAKGISGPLNTNADNQLNVTQNKRVAGTDVKIEISPGDAKEIKGGIKKLLTRKTGGGTRIASGPSGGMVHDAPKQKATPQPDAPRAVPNVYSEAPKAKPTFDQRVIVNADPTNTAVNAAVQKLANKNPGNTVVVTPNADGTPKVLQGTLAGGTTKLEFVGHGDGNSLSKFDSNQITDVVKNLAKDGNTSIDKLNLVGCGTACATDGPSLVNDVKNKLQEQGIKPQVKGYETAITVNEAGRKQVAPVDDVRALGKGNAIQRADVADAPINTGADQPPALPSRAGRQVPSDMPPPISNGQKPASTDSVASMAPPTLPVPRQDMPPPVVARAQVAESGSTPPPPLPNGPKPAGQDAIASMAPPALPPSRQSTPPAVVPRTQVADMGLTTPPPVPNRPKPVGQDAVASTAPPALPPSRQGMPPAVVPRNQVADVGMATPPPVPNRPKPAGQDAVVSTAPPALPARNADMPPPLPQRTQVAKSDSTPPPPLPSREHLPSAAPETTTRQTKPVQVVRTETVESKADFDAMLENFLPLSVWQATLGGPKTNNVYTDAELAALNLYSVSYYKNLNKQLRTNEPLSVPNALIDKGIQTAFPKYLSNKQIDNPGTEKLFRGGYVDGTLQENGTLHSPTYLSTTKDFNAVNEFLTADNSLNVIFGKSGLDMDGFAHFDDEKEVLFNRDTDFNILLKVPGKNAGPTKYVLEEQGLPPTSGRKYEQDLATPGFNRQSRHTGEVKANAPVNTSPGNKALFDQRVIVNADPTNTAVNNAVQNLANKNPGTTVVVTPNADGTPKVLQGTLAGGTTKLEFVGHGDGNSLSKFDSNQITDVVKNLAKDGNTSIDKLNLVGCGTACATDGSSLVNDVKNKLQEQGIKPQVKGYETAITVNEAGRKQVAKVGDADALAGESLAGDAGVEHALLDETAAYNELNARTPTEGTGPAPKEILRFGNLAFKDGYVLAPTTGGMINGHMVGEKGSILAMQYPGVSAPKGAHNDALDAKYLVNFADTLRNVHTIFDVTELADQAKHHLIDYRPETPSKTFESNGRAAEFLLANKKAHPSIADASTGKLKVTLTEPDGQKTKLAVDYLNAPIEDFDAKGSDWLDIIANDINTAKGKAEAEGKCIAVHCTAGVGRTGQAIIAAYLKEERQAGNLDSTNTKAMVDYLILELRKERGTQMVQRPGQYGKLLTYAKDLAAGKFDGASPQAEKLDHNPLPPTPVSDGSPAGEKVEGKAPRKYPLPPKPATYDSNFADNSAPPVVAVDKTPAAKPVRTVPPPPLHLPGKAPAPVNEPRGIAGASTPAAPVLPPRKASPTLPVQAEPAPPEIAPRSPVDSTPAAPTLPPRKASPTPPVQAEPAPPKVAPRSPVDSTPAAPTLPPRKASPTPPVKAEPAPPEIAPRSPVDGTPPAPTLAPRKVSPAPPAVAPRPAGKTAVKVAPTPPPKPKAPQIVDVSSGEPEVVLRRDPNAPGSPAPVVRERPKGVVFPDKR